jgi:hypothetical protein
MHLHSFLEEIIYDNPLGRDFGCCDPRDACFEPPQTFF